MFKNGEWRLFYPDAKLGEAVFFSKTFSKAISDAFSFMNKKEKKRSASKK